MLNMSDINDIRELAVKGYRISEIHEKTGVDRKTIRKYLLQEDFSEIPPTSVGRPSVLDPFKPTIEQWIKENDKLTWSKQHHTAQRMYDRLRKEAGYTGSYDTVRKYMAKIRRDVQNKATQELIWEPGYAEVDFGEADFFENNIQVRRKYLVVSFPYSNYPFVQLFGGETAECVCQGLKDIFERIGGVPKVLVFDNATGVGHRVHDKVIETSMFQRFRAHYRFSVRFCNPESGWEKGCVENKVGDIRRNHFVPIPHYENIENYNQQLFSELEPETHKIHYKKQQPVYKLFEEDKASLLILPSKPFEVCRYDHFKADGYGRICMDGKHHYSTKPENHGKKVLVGIRAHYIDILEENGQLLIRHKRIYGDKRTYITDYSTTLEVLSRNAGAWNNSGVRKDLPDPVRDYLDSLEKAELKSRLRLLNDLNKKYGYEAAIQAISMAHEKNGSIRESDATVIAERITGYGIDTPPESGPALSAYDEVFIYTRRNGGIAS